MASLLDGEYPERLAGLFRRAGDGYVSLGMAHTAEPLGALEHLAEWTCFRDYLMEGFVSFFIRTRNAAPGLILEVRFSGTNRDQYVIPALKHYLRSAGINDFRQLTV